MKFQMGKELRANLIRVFLVLIMCTVFYSLGFVVGRDGLRIDFKNGRFGIINPVAGQPKNVDFSTFWEAWNTVKRNFVGRPDENKMLNGAIQGMMSSLNDPYTVYMPLDENNKFREDISGHFDGVGIEVEMKDGLITVVSPLEGSPAEKAGVKAQDVITAVDKKSTTNMLVEDVVNLIRGKSGTTVVLTVARKGIEKPLDITITRGTIYIKSVKWEIKEGNIAYVKVGQFGEDTFSLFDEAIDKIKEKKPKGIIIDLRNNPGGLLDTAVDMVSLVMKPGVVVQIKDKSGNVEKDMTTLKPKLLSTKMVVLINGGSASASEIFAGAIQDSKRGIVIGEKSFGKGSVQDLTQLENGASIKVTIAKWLTPSGRQIDRKGIEPDIKVANSEDASVDLVLNKALEEVKK